MLSQNSHALFLAIKVSFAVSCMQKITNLILPIIESEYASEYVKKEMSWLHHADVHPHTAASLSILLTA